MATVQEFDYSVDLLRALLWQYEEAPGLQAILRQKSDWYTVNQTDFWTDWETDVFDLTTANEFGCAVWGVILGIPLSLSLPGTGSRPVFGFGIHNRNFGWGNFGRLSAGVASLTLEQKRIILRLRYLQLISDGSAVWSNFVMREIFGGGYVLDPGDMTAVYVFTTGISGTFQQVLLDFDLLPRPAGVKITILPVDIEVFGFGPTNQNYENGQFYG